MLSFGRLVVAIAVCLVAARADAQTPSSTRRAFVDVPIGPDWDDAYSDRTRVPGTTWETGFAFGFDSGTSGVECGLSVPQWHVKNIAPQRYRYAGPSYEWERQGHLYERSGTLQRRSIDLTILHRTNVLVNRHVTFSWLVGGGHVYRPEQSTNVTKEVLPDGQLTEVDARHSASSRNYLAAVTRLDVEFRVGPRLSVVPRLRVTAFPSLLDDSGRAPRLFMARPEVAVRWRF